MSDTRLSSSLRSVRQGLDPDSRRAALVERMRYRPWAPTVCERCNSKGTWRDCSRHREDQLSCGPSCGVWREAVPCPSCAGTGSPLQARLELAAYCGDEAARAVVGPDGPGSGFGWACADNGRFDLWVRGLSRWSDLHESAPGWVLVRAAVATARLTKVAPCGPVNAGSWGACCPMHSGFQVASATAGAWLACPCDEHAQACREASLALDPTPSGRGIDYPESAFLQALAAIFWRHEGVDARTGQRRAVDEGRANSHAEHAVREAVKVAGEQAAREAIASFLRSWALGEDEGQRS